MKQGLCFCRGGGGDNFPTFHFKYLLKPTLSFSALIRDDLQESHIARTIKKLVDLTESIHCFLSAELFRAWGIYITVP